MQRFDEQRDRGVDGFGLYDGQEQNMVKATKEDKILEWLCKYDSNLIMFHHRYPTSTKNTKRTAHPFSTKDYFGDTEYILVHNGGVRNDWSIKKDHEALGIKYQTETKEKIWVYNDSEVFLWELALYLEGKQSKINTYGPTAFVCIKRVNGVLEKMYFGRNSERPLVIDGDESGVVVASKGDGDEVDVNQLYTWYYKSKKLRKKSLFFPKWYSDMSSTGSYTPTVVHGTNNISDEMDRSWYSGQPVGTAPKLSDIVTTAIQATKDYLNKKHPKIHSDGMIEYAEENDPIIEYEHDPQTQELVPVVGTGVSGISSRDDLRQRFEVNDDEVEKLVIEFLVAVDGEFESAYMAMEADYEPLVTTTETPGSIREALKLERAMELLLKDPEYQAGKKYSSHYQALFHQMSLEDKIKEDVRTA